jgi:hypothetical protein
MCISCIISFVCRVNHNRVIVVLNIRDKDLATNCLGAMTLGELLKKYGKEPTMEDDNIVGLFNDNIYASTQDNAYYAPAQIASKAKKGALLVDERLHVDDPRRNESKTWGKERGGFCIKYAKSSLPPKAFAESCATIKNQHPHLFACWDIDSGFATYRTDGGGVVSFTPWSDDQTVDNPFVFVAQTCGDAPNPRRSSMLTIANTIPGRYFTEEHFYDNILEELSNTDLPKEGSKLLPLGKPDAYERLVESVRIPYSESQLQKGTLMQWATRTSSVLFSHGNGRYVDMSFKSRHYTVPTNVSMLNAGHTDSETIVVND